MNIALASLIRTELLHAEGVRRLPQARRFARLLTSGTAPESILFLETGFVKLIRRGEDGKEVILSIVGPGEVLSEHVLVRRAKSTFTAEMLHEGVIYEIPRDIFLAFCKQHPEVWQMLWEVAVMRQLEAEQKTALLCLEDVGYRVLYYLEKLAPQFATPATDQDEYSLPLSQSELASLVGSTRETTSTTLNSLARQGLLRLGRRLVTVKSLDAIRSAAAKHGAKAASQTVG